MNHLVERFIRLFAVPFLSVASLVGVGYSLWLFGLPDATVAEEQADGKLEVKGVASTPFSLEILPPTNYDGYRIVYDQGGIGSRYDEDVGVRLSPANFSCRLSSLYLPLEPSSLRLEYSLSSSCACFDRIQFLEHPASNYLLSKTYLLSEEAISWETVADPVEGYAYSYTFSLAPAFRWRTGQKPTESEEWETFMNGILDCNSIHHLVVNLENVI